MPRQQVQAMSTMSAEPLYVSSPSSVESFHSTSSRKHQVSSLTLCCNMVLSITGTAVLGISAQMKTFGWIFTPVVLVMRVLVTSEMVHLVSETSNKLEKDGIDIVSYQDFAEAALGQTGWWLSAVSSTLSLFGMIFGGLILEAHNLQLTMPISWSWPLGGNEKDAGRKWWALLLTSTTLFYSFVDMGSLLHNSAWIGIVLTLFCMVCVYGGTFDQFQYGLDFNDSCRDGEGMPYHSLGINVAGDGPFDSFLNTFSVFSYIMYAFAIVVTLPTLRSTMREKASLTWTCVVAFLIVALEFLVIMLASYWVFGNLGPENIIDGLKHRRDQFPGWWATVNPWNTGTPTGFADALGWGLTLHLLCSDAIYVPVTVVATEALLPRSWVARRSVSITVRVFVALVRLIVAAQVQDFIKMTNLTSAACVTMNNIILPVLCFYVVGPHRLNGTGVGFRFQLRRLVHAMILAFGVFSMVFGTISALRDLHAASSAPLTGSFPRPGCSQECREAYCALHLREPHCAR